MSFNAWAEKYSLLINIVLGVIFLSTARNAWAWRKDRLLLVFLTLGTIYPFGWAVKIYHLGPLVLRGYVADIGFVPAFTLYSIISWYHRDKDLALLEAKRTTLVGFVIAMGVELFQLYVINPAAARQRVSVPVRGDWMDVATFVVMTSVMFYLLHRLKVRDALPPPQERLLPRAVRRKNRSENERRRARRANR